MHMKYAFHFQTIFRKCCAILLACAILLSFDFLANIAYASEVGFFPPPQSFVEHECICGDLPVQIDSIAAACVLNDDTVAFAAQGNVFFYHFSCSTATHVDLHHPQLTSKSDLKILTILKIGEKAVVIPIYDYQAAKKLLCSHR